MFGHNILTRSRIVRVVLVAIVTTVTTTIFLGTAAGSDAAVFSFMDSVKGVIGFAGAQPATVRTARQQPSALTGVPAGDKGISSDNNSNESGKKDDVDQDAPRGMYRGVITAERFDVSPPLRTMKGTPVKEDREREEFEDRPSGLEGPYGIQDVDQTVQSVISPFGQWEIPAPLVSFDGPSNISSVSPPDPVGDVGPNHYVAMSNLSFAVYNKAGALLFGPALNNTLWAGFGGPCQTENAGDPIVIYDQFDDRWILTQFTAAGPNYFNCVAVSTSPDPTGTYFRYAFSTGTNFPDYPKYGMWRDALYISTREFAGGTTFTGVGAYAVNRAQLVAGNPAAQVISFLVTPASAGGAFNIGDGLLPADADGSTLPPSGAPNYFLGTMDNGGPYTAPSDAILLWKFTANFVTPGSSTFSLANTIPIAPFDTIFPCTPTSRNCIPQPGTTNKVDHLGYRQRALHRAAYRNYGTHESIVTNQSVEASANMSGIRWWEIRSPNSSPVLRHDATYAPGTTDGIHRWMGSIAMDADGNMALGYSASDATTTFPSSRYTGRLAGDPLNTMPQGEGAIVNGTGSQTGSSRWGDYTSMNIDPTDDCTFWYVNQYIPVTSSVGWRLRIGSFKFPTCSAATPTATNTPTNTATNTATNTPTGSPTPGGCVWAASTVHPVTILDQATAAVGGHLYVFGGVSTTVLANARRFDGTTWTDIAPLPAALEFPTAVSDGTNIYILGGALTGTGTPQTTLYRYNVALDTYTTLAPFTTGTWNSAAVFLGGKIYKFAGTGPATASTNVLEIYDIATNTWSAGAPYPLLISFVSAFTQGGFIYGAGGIQSVGSVATDKTYRYDPIGNTWDDAAITDLPATRWGAASGFFNGGGLLAGGYVNGTATANISNTAISWNPGTNTWSSLANMIGERARMTGAVLGSSFYVIGGRSMASSGFVGTNDNQKLTCGVFVADLSITKNDGVTSYTPGGTVTYTITASNAGPSAATGATITDMFPPEIISANWVCAGSGGGTCPVSGSGSINQVVNLPSGGSVTYTVVASISGAAQCRLSNTAIVAPPAGVVDPNLADNSATDVDGGPGTASDQNFDGVVAPALPAGWTTAFTGGESPWVTTITTPDTPPNAAFAPNPAVVGDTELVSPSIPITASGGSIVFRNKYITESTFDGMVLEISIAGGAYQDIITAGGSFVSGGYNGTLSTAFMNPLGGRMAWTGTSAGGYIATEVTVPAAASGQNIQLKWRMGSDNSVAATGVWVDTILVNSCTPITPSAMIGGTITYGNAIGSPAPPRFVKNVSVASVSGTPSVGPVITGTPGTYTLTGFGAGSYTIKPTKPGGPNSAISSTDAGRVAQGVAASPAFVSQNQRFAADVNGSGVVSSQDAGKIAQFVAGLPIQVPNFAGEWRFFVTGAPSPLPTPPQTYDDSRSYASVSGNLTGQDFVGLLLGDVSGNWNPAVHPRPAAGPERSTAVELPQMTASTGKEIVIPVNVQGVANKDIIAYEFNLTYDPAVIQPMENPVDVKGTVSRGLSVVTNPYAPGLLRVVVYGPMPIDQNGVLLNLRFMAVGAAGSVSPLTFERIMFGEDEPAVAVIDGLIELF